MKNQSGNKTIFISILGAGVLFFFNLVPVQADTNILTIGVQVTASTDDETPTAPAPVAVTRDPIACSGCYTSYVEPPATTPTIIPTNPSGQPLITLPSDQSPAIIAPPKPTPSASQTPQINEPPAGTPGFIEGSFSFRPFVTTLISPTGDSAGYNAAMFDLYQAMVAAYETTQPTHPTDLNKDKMVDLVDFSILSYYWGE